MKALAAREDLEQGIAAGRMHWPNPEESTYRPGDTDEELIRKAEAAVAALTAQGRPLSARAAWAWMQEHGGARRRHAEGRRIAGFVLHGPPHARGRAREDTTPSYPRA